MLETLATRLLLYLQRFWYFWLTAVPSLPQSLIWIVILMLMYSKLGIIIRMLMHTASCNRVKTFISCYFWYVYGYFFQSYLFLTGLVPFMNYLDRLYVRNSPHCTCGAMGNADHYMFIVLLLVFFNDHLKILIPNLLWLGFDLCIILAFQEAISVMLVRFFICDFKHCSW